MSNVPAHTALTVDALTRTAQTLARTGIRSGIRALSGRKCFPRLSVLKLGSETTRRLYPDAAALIEWSV